MRDKTFLSITQLSSTASSILSLLPTTLTGLDMYAIHLRIACIRWNMQEMHDSFGTTTFALECVSEFRIWTSAVGRWLLWLFARAPTAIFFLAAIVAVLAAACRRRRCVRCAIRRAESSRRCSSPSLLLFARPPLDVSNLARRARPFLPAGGAEERLCKALYKASLPSGKAYALTLNITLDPSSRCSF